MQLISKFNKRNQFSLHIIDIFSKYAKIVPSKHKIWKSAIAETYLTTKICKYIYGFSIKAVLIEK